MGGNRAGGRLYPVIVGPLRAAISTKIINAQQGGSTVETVGAEVTTLTVDTPFAEIFNYPDFTNGDKGMMMPVGSETKRWRYRVGLYQVSGLLLY